MKDINARHVKLFTKALPVWEKNTRYEMNYELSFRTVLRKHSNAFFKVATSCNYRLWINCNFLLSFFSSSVFLENNAEKLQIIFAFFYFACYTIWAF